MGDRCGSSTPRRSAPRARWRDTARRGRGRLPRRGCRARPISAAHRTSSSPTATCSSCRASATTRRGSVKLVTVMPATPRSACPPFTPSCCGSMPRPARSLALFDGAHDHRHAHRRRIGSRDPPAGAARGPRPRARSGRRPGRLAAIRAVLRGSADRRVPASSRASPRIATPFAARLAEDVGPDLGPRLADPEAAVRGATSSAAPRRRCEPVFEAAWARAGNARERDRRLPAGMVELPPELFGAASLVAVDSRGARWRRRATCVAAIEAGSVAAKRAGGDRHALAATGCSAGIRGAHRLQERGARHPGPRGDRDRRAPAARHLRSGQRGGRTAAAIAPWSSRAAVSIRTRRMASRSRPRGRPRAPGSRRRGRACRARSAKLPRGAGERSAIPGRGASGRRARPRGCVAAHRGGARCRLNPAAPPRAGGRDDDRRRVGRRWGRRGGDVTTPLCPPPGTAGGGVGGGVGVGAGVGFGVGRKRRGRGGRCRRGAGVVVAEGAGVGTGVGTGVGSGVGAGRRSGRCAGGASVTVTPA